MRLKRAFITVHKWIGLIVGVQVVVWMLSGAVMAVFPIEQVRGENNIARQDPALLDGLTGLIAPDAAVTAAGGSATAATLTILAGEPVYEVKMADGAAALIDARSGVVMSPIPEALARRIAEADFIGDASALSAELITEEGGDYRGRLPAWRIQFGDADNTRIYVAANDGRISARRNGTWRIYDFFWMLHIMDYETREDFNTPLLIIAALLGLGVAITGIPLLWWGVVRPLFGRRRRT